jgi:uncharacterized protein YlaI
MLRCSICDYTSEEGSEYADVRPGAFKLHSHPNGDFLCEECERQYEENVYDLGLDDIDED